MKLNKTLFCLLIILVISMAISYAQEESQESPQNQEIKPEDIESMGNEGLITNLDQISQNDELIEKLSDTQVNHIGYDRLKDKGMLSKLDETQALDSEVYQTDGADLSEFDPEVRASIEEELNDVEGYTVDGNKIVATQTDKGRTLNIQGGSAQIQDKGMSTDITADNAEVSTRKTADGGTEVSVKGKGTVKVNVGKGTSSDSTGTEEAKGKKEEIQGTEEPSPAPEGLGGDKKVSEVKASGEGELTADDKGRFSARGFDQTDVTMGGEEFQVRGGDEVSSEDGESIKVSGKGEIGIGNYDLKSPSDSTLSFKDYFSMQGGTFTTKKFLELQPTHGDYVLKDNEKGLTFEFKANNESKLLFALDGKDSEFVTFKGELTIKSKNKIVGESFNETIGAKDTMVQAVISKNGVEFLRLTDAAFYRFSPESIEKVFVLQAGESPHDVHFIKDVDKKIPSCTSCSVVNFMSKQIDIFGKMVYKRFFFRVLPENKVDLVSRGTEDVFVMQNAANVTLKYDKDLRFIEKFSANKEGRYELQPMNWMKMVPSVLEKTLGFGNQYDFVSKSDRADPLIYQIDHKTIPIVNIVVANDEVSAHQLGRSVHHQENEGARSLFSRLLSTLSERVLS